MELRVLYSKAYKSMGPEELEDMSKQQFILGVRNNIIRERLIVHRPKNLKEAFEYGRLLEVANRTARGVTSVNVKGVFTTIPTPNNLRLPNQTNIRMGHAFGQQANTPMRNGPVQFRYSLSFSYSIGYVSASAPPEREN